MSVLQRACACGSHTIGGGECESCQKNEAGDILRRRATNNELLDQAPPIVDEVLQSTGQSLDASTRTFFESRFGRDFSGVQVHSDTHAAESARELNALAYTVGPDTVFAAGQYSPQTSVGRKLLAHELTHVLQQSDGQAGMQKRSAGDVEDDELEDEAEVAAAEIADDEAMEQDELVETGPDVEGAEEADEGSDDSAGSLDAVELKGTGDKPKGKQARKKKKGTSGKTKKSPVGKPKKKPGKPKKKAPANNVTVTSPTTCVPTVVTKGAMTSNAAIVADYKKDNDIAGDDQLASKFFNAQSLADAIAPVLYAALSFFVRHD